MEIISYRPSDDQFWIACSDSEASRFFIPHMDKHAQESFRKVVEDRKHWDKCYIEMVKRELEIDYMPDIFFNVSRDLSVCFPESPHFPFSHMWNAYSPFRRCKHIKIANTHCLSYIKVDIIKDNVYTDEELHWTEGGNTGMLPTRITPSEINYLRKDQIFVFGSNFRGHHGGGASKVAVRHYGAVDGIGEGLQGQSYAIPTSEGVAGMIPAIERFTSFARQHQELQFYVTAIGCGNAGLKPDEVAPYFYDAAFLSNVYLPLSFWKIIIHREKENESEKAVRQLVESCSHLSRHSDRWHGEPYEYIYESLDRHFRWLLGVELKVVSPTAEEPMTWGLPQDLNEKILNAFRKC